MAGSLRTLAVAVACLAGALAQDQPAPADVQGKWEGDISAAFAEVNPSVPGSYECLPGGACRP